MKSLTLLLTLILTSPLNGSQPYVKIKGAWVRILPPGVPATAAYLEIYNTGPKPITLSKASSDQAAKIEFHETKIENGMASMSQLQDITIAPGKSMTMKPGGIHMMVMGLKTPLQKGHNFPITLSFLNQGTVQIFADPQ